MLWDLHNCELNIDVFFIHDPGQVVIVMENILSQLLYSHFLNFFMGLGRPVL